MNRNHRRLYVVGVALGVGALGLIPRVQAVPPQKVEHGAIHEAYITPITETVSLEAIAQEPPPNILERIPPQPAVELEWIPGYWSWVPQRNDFVWVSGVWRRPPPGRHWISGLWKNYDEGWVWVRGFWSDVPAVDISYIAEEPPDQLDENVKPPPGGSTIWLPGYWNYSPQTKTYTWLAGHWVDLDQNWVLMPAHYVWRPSGYVFVASHWDWPIEVRGRAFATVYVPPRQRAEVYEPVLIVESPVIISTLVTSYPNYSYFLHHHYRCHPTFWVEVNTAPPWFGWDDWWCLSWHDHWGAWWWYTHPGYSQPAWITVDVCRRMPPPSVTIINQVTIVNAPVIVTRAGVVTPHQIRVAVEKENGKTSHILSADVKVVEKIKISAKVETTVVVNQPAPVLRPVGKKSANPADKIAAVPLPRPAAKAPAPAPVGPAAAVVKTPTEPEKKKETPVAKPETPKASGKAGDKTGEKTTVEPKGTVEKPKEKVESKTETNPPVTNPQPRPPIKKHEPPAGTPPVKEGDAGTEPKSKGVEKTPEKSPEKPQEKPLDKHESKSPTPGESKPPIHKPAKEGETPTEPKAKSVEKTLEKPQEKPEGKSETPHEPKPPIRKSGETPGEPKSKGKEESSQPPVTKPVREGEVSTEPKPPIKKAKPAEELPTEPKKVEREKRDATPETAQPPLKKHEVTEPKREADAPVEPKVRDREKREPARETIPIPSSAVESRPRDKGVDKGNTDQAPVPSQPLSDDTTPKSKKGKDKRDQ